MSSPEIYQEIEDLRRLLHKSLGSGYDPARLQALVPISQELDRLAVELGRQQLNNTPQTVKV